MSFPHQTEVPKCKYVYGLDSYVQRHICIGVSETAYHDTVRCVAECCQCVV